MLSVVYKTAENSGRLIWNRYWKMPSIQDRHCVLLAFLPSNCFLYGKSKATDSHVLTESSENLIILYHLSFSKVKEP